MAIKFACPACGNDMIVLKLDKGKDAECPKCRIWSPVPDFTEPSEDHLNCRVRYRNSVLDLPPKEPPVKEATVHAPVDETLMTHPEADAGETGQNGVDDRSGAKDLVAFRELLMNATPHSFVANALVLVNIAVSIAMGISGANVVFPLLSDIIAWGGKYNYFIVNLGEWWRLVSAFFIHSGVVHLVIDMWFLWVLGNIAEKIFGNVSFFLLYVAGGLGGTIASFLANPLVVGAAASGPVLGTAGGLIAFLALGKVAVPPAYGRRIVRDIALLGIGSLVPVFFFSGMDVVVNLGGLSAGFAAGLALKRPLPAREDSGEAGRYALFSVASVTVVAALLFAGLSLRDPEEGALLYDAARAEAFLVKGRLDDAIAIIEKKPGILLLLENREIVEGLASEKKGDYGKAVTAFAEALRKNPDNPSIRMLLAGAYMDLKSYTDAINTLEVLVLEEPRNAVAYGNLAWAYYLSGDFDKCITLSNKALELDKSLLYARYNIAISMLRKKDVEGARVYYEGISVPGDAASTDARKGAISDLKDLVTSGVMKDEAREILKNVFGLTEREIDRKEL